MDERMKARRSGELKDKLVMEFGDSDWDVDDDEEEHTDDYDNEEFYRSPPRR
jgi:hypothetical protein